LELSRVLVAREDELLEEPAAELGRSSAKKKKDMIR